MATDASTGRDGQAWEEMTCKSGGDFTRVSNYSHRRIPPIRAPMPAHTDTTAAANGKPTQVNRNTASTS